MNNDDVPADQCGVLLENGNTWWYPLETVAPAFVLRAVPRSVRRLKLAHHGIHPV